MLVILGGLGAYLLWIEPRTRSQAKTDQQTLYTIDSEQVVEIEVQSGVASIRLEREPGGPFGLAQDRAWRFSDRSDPVDQFRVQGVSLTGPTVRRTLEGVSDLGQFGLNPPQALVRLGLQDGAEVVLQLGNGSPDASGRYVLKAAEAPVYLVDDFWAQNMLRLVSEAPVQATPTPEATAAP